MTHNDKTHQLGHRGIGSLLLSYAIPSIAGTTAASLYNIIDRVFIGQGVGAMAITGLALTLPLMNLQTAFGTLVGVGSSSVISIKMGKNDKEGAVKVLGNALILNVIIALLYGIASLLFLDDILMLFGGSQDSIPYAKAFIRPLLICNVITCLYYGMNNIIRASGYPTKAMYTMFISVGLNILLAPVFIFGFKWGIEGAAIATLASQTVGAVWVMSHLFSKKSYLHFTKESLKWDTAIVKDILSIGLSPFIIFLCSSLVVVITNMALSQKGGDLAIGAYGIINTYALFFVTLIVGLNQAMQPIVGYNYGAGKYPRVIRTLKLTITVASIITCFGFLMAELFPIQIVRAFTADDPMIQMGADGLRIVFLSFPIVGAQIVTSTFFQSMGKASKSIFLSLLRQLILLVPALLIFPKLWNLDGVWISFPVADALSFVISMVVLYLQIKKFKQLPNTTVL